MALKQSAPLAPHLSLIRALSQARMNLKCCSLVDEHWGAIVKRLKNSFYRRRQKMVSANLGFTESFLRDCIYNFICHDKL